MPKARFINNALLMLAFGSLLSVVPAVYLLSGNPLEHPRTFAPESEPQASIAEAAGEVDAAFRTLWQTSGVSSAGQADPLAIARRMSLGLAGTIPSVEEIRILQQLPESHQRHWFVSRLLESRRTSDYLAERIARALVGVENGPFLIYRRSRFVDWFSDQIAEGRPWNKIVTDLVTEDGLWTDTPAVNFVTRTIQQDEDGRRPDPVLLAGGTTRAFLGMRIDCLQCHDDFLGNVNLGSPSDPSAGTQLDFHALAAFYSQTRNSLLGIRDNLDRKPYRVQLLNQNEESEIEPEVPFLRDLANPEIKNYRQRLANWMTHKDNRPFARAIINRMWALMLGRPLIEPVDDIPLDGPFPPAIEILTDDFLEHDFNLHRLIRIIAQTEVFGLDSAADFEVTDQHHQRWAVFPITRLRPEQCAGAILQSTRLKTIDASAPVTTRLIHLLQQREFVTRFGDAGADEFRPRGETISQRLLLLNGDVIADRLESPFLSPAHLIPLSRDANKAIEVAFLSTLSRLPTRAEQENFAPRLSDGTGQQNTESVIDLYWALINSAEFRWNH